MIRLLVSVRDAAEARAALDGGADLIDVKEPHRGALGAADADVLAEVVNLVAGRVPTSAALGELRAFSAYEASLPLPQSLDYFKVGLAECAADSHWPRCWNAICARAPAGVRPVAVAYADWRAAAAPSPDEILTQAARIEAAALLVDTYCKDGRTLTDHFPINALGDFVERVRHAGLLVVLAGSLSAATLPPVLALKPDFVAVRGAACRASRTGLVEAARVAQLKQLLLSSPRLR